MRNDETRERSAASARAPMVLGVMTGLAGFGVGWATGVEHLGWTMGLLIGWWPAMILGAGAAWVVGIALPNIARAMARNRVEAISATTSPEPPPES